VPAVVPKPIPTQKACFLTFQLAFIERVCHLEGVLRAVGALALDGDLLAGGKVLEVKDRKLVRARDEVVVGPAVVSACMSGREGMDSLQLEAQVIVVT